MPEQAEWQPDNDNSGDYRWHPHYARRRAGNNLDMGAIPW